jgi:hypothetical protein
MPPYDLPRSLTLFHRLNRDIRTDPTCPGIRAGKGEQRNKKTKDITKGRDIQFHAPLPPLLKSTVFLYNTVVRLSRQRKTERKTDGICDHGNIIAEITIKCSILCADNFFKSLKGA